MLKFVTDIFVFITYVPYLLKLYRWIKIGYCGLYCLQYFLESGWMGIWSKKTSPSNPCGPDETFCCSV